MNLYIDRDALSRGLARVQTIIERRGTNPMLAHVLLDARADTLLMTATDLEVAFVGEISANVEARGQVAVDAANLFQIVRALPEATVHLKLSAGNRLEIQCGRAAFKLPGHSAVDFPALPAFDGRGIVSLREGDLRRIVEQTSFAVATDDVRYGINGAFLEERVDGDATLLRMVATDGHRLALAECPISGACSITPRMLVPRKALAVLRKLLEGDDAEIMLSFGDGALHISRPGQTFWFRMLDGEFPNYRGFLPTQHKHEITMQREALLAAVRRVAILVNDRSRAVKFAFLESELEIQLLNTDRGEVTESVGVELNGEPITVGFNVRYLLDILGVMSGDLVRLSLAHLLAPCLLTDPAREDAMFVLMPMRLD